MSSRSFQPFAMSGRYYDLFYRDKDYRAEAAYVLRLLDSHRSNAVDLLDLGSGTGRHAEWLAQSGRRRVVGIEINEPMLQIAETRRGLLPDEVCERLSYIQGDARTVRCGRRFDAVLALFHVLDYQVTNADLRSILQTAAYHLPPGGILLFDFWFGPAVLTDRPIARERSVEEGGIRVRRTAVPRLDPVRNVVEVHYDFNVRTDLNENIETFGETHRMRYLFLPEIDLLLEHTEFELIMTEEWMTGRPLDFDTWYGCAVARKAG